MNITPAFLEVTSPTTEPLVAVVIPALNEAGKIGRVLDKVPRDGRFEAVVVDDGSSDGTGEEARAHGAAVVLRHETRMGLGAAIRDGFRCAAERGRPYVALVAGDDQHEPSELAPALDALLSARADYLAGSRWMRGGRVIGGAGGAVSGRRSIRWPSACSASGASATRRTASGSSAPASSAIHRST